MRLAMEFKQLDSICLKALPFGFMLKTCSKENMLEVIPFLRRNFPGDWQGEIEKYCSGVGKQELFSLYSANMPVASALAQTTAAKIGILSMVAVDPNYRQRGLGKAVVSAALDFFRRAGQDRVVLVTDSGRIGAIGFYLKLGFRPLILDQEQAKFWGGVLKKVKFSWSEEGSVFAAKAGME